MLGLASGLIYQGYVAVAIEDYMWDNGVTGELTPRPTTYDFNDTWDLDGNDDYMPAEASVVSDEGYWDLDSNSDVQPLDV